MRSAARASLSQGEQSVATAQPGLAIRTQIVVGRAQPELVSHAGDAELIVVGRRGHGRFASLLGSTSPATAGHADGPVVALPTPR
ncbi:universal stress protein [Leekyejoonella antrihumi]|uniref:Universal stress protein n=1 Tax=Leekyejoonella antrihumi TaxID=1660198 RepID=A0A563E1P4_9MICO|nr:universal stress protein [Leekyejoonella antrihumi]TWP35824.1 universal stress protein [Leekyejoonella antrihumi]